MKKPALRQVFSIYFVYFVGASILFVSVLIRALLLYFTFKNQRKYTVKFRDFFIRD